MFKPTPKQYSGHGLGLLTACEDAWDKRHGLHKEMDDSDQLKAPPSSEPTICFKLGTCVCSGAGKNALLFHQRLVQLLKPHLIAKRLTKRERLELQQSGNALPQKPQARMLMETGFIVLRLETDAEYLDASEPAAVASFSDSWGDLITMKALQYDSTGVSPSEGKALQAVHLLHVAYVNFSSWHFTVFTLIHAGLHSAGAETMDVEVPQPVTFAQSVAYFAASIALARPWTVSLFVIRSRDEEIPANEMAPCRLQIKRLATVPSFRFWKGAHAACPLGVCAASLNN